MGIWGAFMAVIDETIYLPAELPSESLEEAIKFAEVWAQFIMLHL